MSRTEPSLAGSATVTLNWLPLVATVPNPRAAAADTSGRALICSTIFGLYHAPPKLFEDITSSPLKEPATLVSIDALMDDAKMVNNATTHTPTSNAAAVL